MNRDDGDGQGDEQGGEWEPAQEALTALLHEALRKPEIVMGMDRAQVTPMRTGQAMLDNQRVLARVRMEQDEVASQRLEQGWRTDARPAARLSAKQVLWLVSLFLIGVGYISLMREAWPAMAVVDQVVAVIGLIAVMGLSVRHAAEQAPEIFTGAGIDLADGPEDPTYGLGERWDVVLTTLILPELHRYLTVSQERVYNTVLRSRKTVNLYTEDDEDVVVTAAAQRLGRVIGRSGSGAIALAGQRGAGKTTVIQSITRGRFHGPDVPLPLTVVAAAPARYEARDFVLHLHALLCKAVVTKADETLARKIDDTWLAEPGERGILSALLRRLVVPIAVGAATAYLGSLALGRTVWTFAEDLRRSAAAIWNGFPQALLGVFFGGTFLHSVVMVVTALVALYLAGVALGLVLDAIGGVFWFAGWLWRTTTGRRRVRRGRAALRHIKAQARHQLDRIRFLQTFTTGWSGKISTPLKGEAGRTWQSQRAEQQLTHPEVVEQFRRYAGATAAAMTAAGLIDRIVIAIDELDKIGQPEKAHEFVNDIKGVFGIPGCLFLVSVSDDAFTAFEQRGIAVRDAFDSAFAEMIRMDHFTFEESRLWILARLPDAPEQFCLLLHCLSGGLPRDLRRTVIEMLDVTFDVYNPTLAEVATRLVGQELLKKSHAFAGMARAQEPRPGLPRLMADLLATRTAATPGEMLELAESLSPDDENYARLRAQSSGFLLFCATILEVFTDELDEERLRGTHVASLADVRQQMASDPEVARQLLATFRKDHGLAYDS
ncbi:hypothetical protein [Kibdelosporangium phytohabitans]|uniref:KAP NTPase domain-containing protein n=1 Tax=Kibdelosporangium phytohabitans TaxID=860235 RepID=A0A0N9I211_9PSEU|nr:hypothetical protein [Kibdelosporangium phytohabitans]ALG08750.1 hypothetical protein AOZ06_19140 [Kibdelosporangium phytohabitans]MBE1470132.1 hypothetical protein [Kibdelosporangium phytohabitans]